MHRPDTRAVNLTWVHGPDPGHRPRDTGPRRQPAHDLGPCVGDGRLVFLGHGAVELVNRGYASLDLGSLLGIIFAAVELPSEHHPQALARLGVV